MMKKFLNRYDAFEKFCVIFYLSFALLIVYYCVFPEPKIRNFYVNEMCYYQIGKHTDFYMIRNNEEENIIFKRVIRRKPMSIYFNNIYYGVKVDTKNNANLSSISDESLWKYKDGFIEKHREKIIEIRETQIVNIKPNHKGIYMAFVFKDNEDGKLYYYYDTRVWAYGKMYSIGLVADIETIATRESRAEDDRDYKNTYMQILNSLQIEKKQNAQFGFGRNV